MLIKRKKLTNVQNIHGVSIADVSETTKLAQAEVQKARQEARIIKQEAQNMLVESQKKLKDAEARANEIIKYTEIEAKKIKEKVYHETLQAANKEAELIKEQARSLLKELFEVKRSTLTEAHNEIIKVALELTEKIIRYQASIDTNVLKTQVIEAIKKATSEADRVMVFVNPVDIETLQKSISDIEKLFPSGVDIVPLTNESVDPGSCIIETKSGQLDASFSAQLVALRELVTRIEVKEPAIEIDEDIIPLQSFSEAQKEHKEEAELIHDLPLESVRVEGNEELLKEEEELRNELLGDEPLIRFPEQEEIFPFGSKKDTEKIVQEELNLPQEVLPFEQKEQTIDVSEQFQQDVESKEQIALEEKIEQIEELNQVDEIEQHEQAKKVETIEHTSKRKKLVLDSLPERTKEEARELDDFDFEEEEEEEKKKEVKPMNVLKPKKAPSTEITKIAHEVEQSSEWKDLVQEEDEE